MGYAQLVIGPAGSGKISVRELISLDDVMGELGLGPNSGFIYCMEHLEENLDDRLTEELDNYLDDDYLVLDCPGQIELFSHIPVLKNFVSTRTSMFVLCICLIHSYLNPEPQVLLSQLNRQMAPQFEKLNKALIELVDQ
ncbi:GPN-loop GTPase 3 [Camellia lanceoleosa]|uniref:GPN-loop GTPase 3 n=1 Tax=Camellia lanceoleosa TaxID=1840588 RepID=A0ACC0F521_9ERIC|nr:GPN-loop GTPase 3 [Camellia lanceoleosa]